ncbi:MAG TPA: nickel pincer cofactor biosynthesis protein LarC [Methanothrix sp.]|nr:nickel pincer cofactor biosynthesis protein LarC [Methanothrix sp.]
MKVLLFDPSAGASGDMIMATLLDLGADLDAVRRAVESVGCVLEVSRQEKSHIMASRARVISDKRFQSLSEAVSILQGSSLQGKALQNALAALDTLAEAESRVHGVPKEEAHFHEVGSLDALADIAGACAARHCLAVERVFSRPVSVGGGFVQSSHGLLAVPGPAALEILRTHKIPWKGGPVEEELLTPTGAALLATLVDEFVPDFPLTRAERVGYGAGKKELILPNVLRAIVADSVPAPEAAARQNHGPHGDRVVQLETNVDDVTGEVLGHLIEKLMQAGALDVSVLPALMKKGRAGFVIRAIAQHDEMELLARIMIRETGSLGVRVFPSIHRFLAERELISVQVEIGGQIFPAQVKVSRMDGKLISAKPEYEDCKRIADETDLPLRMVIKKVDEAGWQAADP